MKMRPLLVIFLFLIIATSVYSAVTKEQAEDGISAAERGIIEMQSAGLNTTFARITLEVAKNIMQNAENRTLYGMDEICDEYSSEVDKRYCSNQAAYLRDIVIRINSSQAAIDEAYYTTVLQFTDDISMRKNEAFLARDKIRAVEFKISEYGLLWVDTKNASDLLYQANQALQAENYEFVRALSQQADNELEAGRSNLKIIKLIYKPVKKFVIDHTKLLAILLIILFIISSIFYLPARRLMLESKIKSLMEEQASLDVLMIQAQTERFKTGEISESVYNVRMDIYKRRLEQAKTRLPIAREKFRKIDEFLSRIMRKNQ